MDAEILATVAVAFLVAGCVKGAVGMGLPTIAVAIMGATLGLREAIPVLIVPSLVANIWQSARPGPLGPLLRRFGPINAASGLGIWFGTMALFRIDPTLLATLLGVVIVAYALVNLMAVELTVTQRQERALSLPVGLVSGVLTGATGSLLLPNIVFLQALHLKRDTFIQATGLTLLIGTVVWAAALLGEGAMDGAAWLLSALALLPTLLGMAVGQWLRGQIPQGRFRTGVYLLLLLLAANLIRKGLVAA